MNGGNDEKPKPNAESDHQCCDSCLKMLFHSTKHHGAGLRFAKATKSHGTDEAAPWLNLDSGFGGKDQAARPSMLATILRMWEALAAEVRVFRMARLFSKEPHLMTWMVTRRVPQRFMALKLGL